VKRLASSSLRLVLFSLLLCCAGCQVHFIAPYDETFDTTMTTVQQDTELFFNKLQDAKQTAAGTYEANAAYYEKTEATLHTLLTRAQATEQADQVATQIADIEGAVEHIQQSHQRDTYMNSEQITIQRGLLESQFRSYFTLELALKNSPSNPNAAKPTAKPAAKK
jgi:hypothetical protein